MPYYPELKVVGWKSGHKSIQKLLKYLKKKRFGEEDAQRVLESVALYCRLVGKNPDEAIAAEKEGTVAIGSAFNDELRRLGADEREIDIRNAHILAFFFENDVI